ncbi:MAG: rhomboid family intramembrane serine protease [Candidatus Limnocylindria bacterium]
MIPLHDLERTRHPAVVTRLLLLAIAAVWVYTLTLLDRPAALASFYDRWSFDWARLVAQLRAGDMDAMTFLPLFTHQFLHAGWLHVLGNTLYLWIFGDNVEDRLGSGRMLLLYLASGALAAVGQGLVAAGPMVGASGAIAAVLGAYLVLSPGARVRTLVFLGIFITVVTLPAIFVIGLWLVVQVLSGAALMRIGAHEATANVAYAAHVTGFVSGFVFAVLSHPRRR